MAPEVVKQFGPHGVEQPVAVQLTRQRIDLGQRGLRPIANRVATARLSRTTGDGVSRSSRSYSSRIWRQSVDS